VENVDILLVHEEKLITWKTWNRDCNEITSLQDYQLKLKTMNSEFKATPDDGIQF